jgi:hypothetical protein
MSSSFCNVKRREGTSWPLEFISRKKGNESKKIRQKGNQIPMIAVQKAHPINE